MRIDRQRKKDRGNPSERLFESLMDSRNVSYSRCGYPDYIMIENDEIIGFIEVKTSKHQQRKHSQERFKRLCKKVGIPFKYWSPHNGFSDS